MLLWVCLAYFWLRDRSGRFYPELLDAPLAFLSRIPTSLTFYLLWSRHTFFFSLFFKASETGVIQQGGGFSIQE